MICKKTGIIIVLFYPDENQIKVLLDTLLKELSYIFLIDNTPNLVNKNLLSLSNKNKSKIYYLPQQINLGIAEAQNIGIKYAREKKGIDYLLFIDQDSIVPESFVNQMLSEYIRISNLGIKIAALGPTPINKDTNVAYKREKAAHNQLGNLYSLPSALISSGMLIAMPTIQDVGFMESKLFIDTVDFEWCWRAKTKGYSCCMTESIKMPHKVGIKDESFFGYKIIVSSSTRYYYQYRNFILLLKRSYVPMNWKIKGILKKTFFLMYIPLMTKNGMKSFRNMIKGLISGVLNK